MDEYSVYIHINKINDKKYIGITRQNVFYRWKNGNGYSDKTYFKSAIKKYGWHNFEHFVLYEGLSKKEAEDIEIELIDEYSTTDRECGYNIQNGGNSIGKHSDETKEKLRRLKLGRFTGVDSSRARKVVCDGRGYETIKDCAENHDVDVAIMRVWLASKRIPKRFYKMRLRYDGDNFSEYTMASRCGKVKVVCNGVIFNTIKDCALQHGVSGSTMLQWLNKVYDMPKTFIDMGLRYHDDNETEYNVRTKWNKRRVVCDGVEFANIVECAKNFDVNKHTMREWLKTYTMPEKFIELGLKYKDDILPIYRKLKPRKTLVECDGIVFNTIKECSDYLNIDSRRVGEYLSGKSKMPTELAIRKLKFIE